MSQATTSRRVTRVTEHAAKRATPTPIPEVAPPDPDKPRGTVYTPHKAWPGVGMGSRKDCWCPIGNSHRITMLTPLVRQEDAS